MVQALINLIGNALKFTQPGGTVSVSANREHEIVLSVSDEGRGIPAEDLEAIFERFHQVQQSDARKLGGTGLGLASPRRSSNGTAVESGWRASSAPVRRSGSRCRSCLPANPDPVDDVGPSARRDTIWT